MTARSARRAPRRRPVLIALVLADAAALLVFWLGYLGRWVPPSVEWRLQLAALVVPPMAWALAAAGVAWLIRARRRGGRGAWMAVALHALVVVAAGVRFWGGASGAAAHPEAAPFRVASLNVGLETPDSPDRFEVWLEALEPTVLALQEAPVWRLHAEPEARVIHKSARRAFRLGYNLTSRWGGRLHVPSFTRRAVADETAGALVEGGGDQAGAWSRAVVDWEGRRVAVYSVHLRSFGPERPWTSGAGGLSERWRRVRALGEDFVRREREARAFRRILDDERLPHVVLGDFNSTPHQWAYAHIGGGLTDVLRGGLAGRPTYPARRPLVRIDALLASPEWEVLRRGVGPGALSDHRPVWADLRLGDPGPPPSAP